MEFIKKYWIVVLVAFGISMFFKPELCALMVGSFISFLGIKSVLFLNKLGKIGIACTGKILEFESDNEGHKTPVVEFTPLNGETIKDKPILSASTDLDLIRTYQNLIDNPVTILYDPDDPKKFVIKDNEGFNYIVFLILIFAGLFFVGLSVYALLGYIKI